MGKLLVSLALVPALFAAGYKSEPAAAPPSDVPAAFQALLNPAGYKVSGPDGVICEIWFRKELPQGATTAQQNTTFPKVPQGSLIAVMHLETDYQDRRGQKLTPGFYSMRHSLFPMNGDHQGVAPQRDFLLLTPLADDSDPNATPDFQTLVNWSKKASKTPHPAVFSYWKEDPKYFDGGMSDQGEGEWALQVKIGDVLVSLLLVGVYHT
jgi:hypothetical protein